MEVLWNASCLEEEEEEEDIAPSMYMGLYREHNVWQVPGPNSLH